MARTPPPRRRRTDAPLTVIDEIYGALVQSAAPSRRGLVEAGYAPDVIADALELLHWRELIDVGDEDSITVFPPDVALISHAADLERRARRARAEVDAAQTAFALARTTVLDIDTTTLTRPLYGLHEITATAVSIEQRITESMDAVVAGGPRLELVVSGVHAAIPDDRATPITRRAIIATGALGDADADADLSSRQELGYDIRTASNLPFNLLIADRTTAIIDTTNRDPQGAGSVLVHDPVIVRMLCAWFDLAHRGATPLAARANASGLSARDSRIFTLMAAGLTDAAIARRLGVSTRTVERRTSWLLEHIDATTRFQAGVKAARAGLI